MGGRQDGGPAAAAAAAAGLQGKTLTSA